jgi:uncharacterized damage-inducible protein DinB
MSSPTISTLDPRYPLGKFQYVPAADQAARDARIYILASLPAKLRSAIAGRSDAALDTPYREGGWTVRQVVHHLADSHLNSFVRFKLALTEDEPTIKAYEEALWAELADSKMPVEVSLKLLEAVHERWVYLLRSLTEEQWTRTFRHPVSGPMTLEKALAIYSWHCEHHLAHVSQAI